MEVESSGLSARQTRPTFPTVPVMEHRVRAEKPHFVPVARKAQHDRLYAPTPSLLRELSRESGLTQRELAAKLIRPQSWVHNCEIGNRRVDLAEFVTWCRVTNVDPQAGLARYLERLQR